MSGPSILITTTVDASLRLIQGFPENLTDRGWAVHIVSSGGPVLASYSLLDGVSTHSLPMERDPHPLKDIQSLIAWIRLIRKLRPSLLYAGTPKASLLALVAARICKIPARVYLVRGLRAETETGLKRRILILLERISMSCATNVVSVSPSLSREIKTVVGRNEIDIVGNGSSNGIDLTKYTSRLTFKERAHARASLGVKPDETLIGFVGRITVDKGIEDALDAIDLLKARDIRVKLLLIGQREHVAPFSEKLARLSDTVIEFGDVPNPEDYLELMDIFVMPSRREGFSNAILEAAALGVPIVACRSTGIIDFVEHEVTGYLFSKGRPHELARSVAWIISNPNHARKIARNAKHRVARSYAREVVQEQYISYLAGLIDGKSH